MKNLVRYLLREGFIIKQTDKTVTLLGLGTGLVLHFPGIVTEFEQKRSARANLTGPYSACDSIVCHYIVRVRKNQRIAMCR